MKKIYYSVCFLFFVFAMNFLISCNNSKFEKFKVFYQKEMPQQDFAVQKLEKVITIESVDNPEEANILVLTSEEQCKNQNLLSEYKSITYEGYMIKKLSRKQVAVIAGDQTGAMYGILDITEQLQMGNTLAEIEEKHINPAYLFRAIKFNLPWDSYRVHESLQLHDETVKDPEFWEDFLDMMAENRFNVLTLWNIHPFPYMIRTKNFPDANPFSDEELRSWQEFWHSLFRMASDRGIKTFMINWNIFVTPSFAEKYGVADYCLPEMKGKGYYGKGDYSPIIQKYTRESITQLIDEYPELSGFGVSQNERMQGVDEQIWQDWIVDTYFDAMDSANRKIEFIMRAHTHPAPELTRKAIEDNAYRLEKVWVPVKFNWSHAHGTPKLMYIHGGSRSTSLWDPEPENYKMVFTMRNEDFFILRWGQPDFVREVFTENDQDYIGGFMIGSETYIPAKEYITKPGPHLNWKYAFEKQWLFYKIWGRLMYDQDTKDEIFEHAFNEKYGINYGDKLLEAHKLADAMPLKLASYYAASWDFTLYSEGFLAGYFSNMGCYYDSISQFISVDEIIHAVTLDTSYVSVKDYINNDYSGEDKITPLQLAGDLEKDSKKALMLIQDMKTDDPVLQYEIKDIEVWANMGLYFSEKLRGATALQYYRVKGDKSKQEESIRHLEKALEYWEKVVTVTNNYIDEIPLLHLGDRFNSGGNIRTQSKFSWKNFTGEVKYDIEIAKKSLPEVNK